VFSLRCSAGKIRLFPCRSLQAAGGGLRGFEPVLKVGAAEVSQPTVGGLSYLGVGGDLCFANGLYGRVFGSCGTWETFGFGM